MKTIFVGNLDFRITEDAIRALFEPHGTVDRVTLMRDRATGRSRGFAFVEMSDTGEADKAIAALNGTTMEDRTLNVNEARPRVERTGSGPGGGGGGGARKGRFGGDRPRREPRW